MGQILQKYPVKHGDRIQEVAARTLGDISRWIDIVSLNKLRRPYISDDLIDQFGPLLGILPLQADLALGATQITNWDTTIKLNINFRSFTSNVLLVKGAILVFTYMDLLGDRIYDVVQITDVSQGMLYSNGHISLTIDFIGVESFRSVNKRLVTHGNGLLHSYQAGDLFQVYGSPLQLTTAVAKTGDTLNLPIIKEYNNYQVSSTKEIVDSLGVDVYLDPVTGQKKAGANGDFLQVKGLQNVEQAVRVRCSTEPNSLALHPEYGNTLKLYIGYNQNSGWPNLALTLLHECILQDPRVKEVVNMEFRQDKDTDFIAATVQINESGQIFTTAVKIV